MFDNLNTIVQTGEDTLDELFGEDETGTGDKKKTTKTKTDKSGGEGDGGKKKSSSTSKEKPLLGNAKATINESSKDDLDDLFSVDDEDEDEEEDEEEVKPAKKTAKKPAKKEEVVEEDEDEEEDETSADDEDEDEEKDTDDEDEQDEDEDENESEAAVKDFLKQRANLLIKKGEWADFEGSDEVEWDEDTFADMEIQQRNYAKQQMREEILDSFGPYGKDIADYASKGGDPDKLIDIFKEQQMIGSLNIETEDDQRAVIMKYETEFLNKKANRVKAYIDSLEASKELATAAKEAKEAMEESLESDRLAILEEQEAAQKRAALRQQESLKKFQSDVSALISGSNDIQPDEKKQLLSVLTKFDKKLKNGTPVNDFYFKFEQFRKDLPNYIKLVRFVMNPDKFIKSIENKGKNEATDKAFKLAVGANKRKRVKAAGGDPGSEKPVRTKFKLY